MSYELVVKAAWKSDPEFVALCKALYGADATAETVIKMAPDVADVHVPGNGKRKKKPPVMDTRVIQKAARDQPRDNHGRFVPIGAATRAVKLEAKRARLDLKTVANLLTIVTALKSSPGGRRVLERALRAAQSRHALAAGGGLAGIGLYEATDDDRVHKSAVDMTGQIAGIDEDKHQVFGWASIVQKDGRPVVDLQGDYITVDELEKAAYEYVQKSRIGGAMHRRVDEHGNLIEKNRPYHAADLIESFVVTPEKIEKMGLPESTPVGWWVGFKVNDPDVWSVVKSGEWKGFSIHGSGRRTTRSIEELDIDGAELTR
jgi:hypothetical protein